MGVPLIDVQARWSYSEIIDSSASHHYDHGHGIAELRAKRATSVPFDQLSEAERHKLAFQNACVRRNLLVYLNGTGPFDIAEINREALAKLLVPPNVWESAGRFEQYMATTSEEPNDARNVALKQQSYKAPIDPVTIGHTNQYPLLIDGFHRAALLWKFGPAGGKLFAYMPRSLKGWREHVVRDQNCPSSQML
jgi:hypothetical protein